MTQPLVLVSGFGSFEEVDSNPSRQIARHLAAERRGKLRFEAVELPVSFHRVPGAIDGFFAQHVARNPVLFCAFGVQKEPWFRLESTARARLTEEDRPDVDGVNAIESEPYAEPEGGGPRRTPLALGRIARALEQKGVAAIGVSHDAGGYVCERAYYRVLEHTDRAGIPGLFVHVPPLAAVPIERQVEVARWVVEAALS